MSRHYASPDEPWFRIGTLEVSTVVLVGLVGVASGIAWVVNTELPQALFFHPGLVADGEVWRIVTWPLANTISVIITALILWYFGRDLEQLVGRTRMLWLIVGAWASLTAASTVVSLVPALSGSSLAGLGVIQLAVLLLWVAEYPNRPFFFGIPAWVFATVIVLIQALTMVAYREYGALLSLVLSFSFVAMMGRRFGILGAYDWIPGRPNARPAAPVRTRHVPRSQARQDERRASDRDRLDALLDQINDQGIGSLTDAQRKELMRLRDRLRKG